MDQNERKVDRINKIRHKSADFNTSIFTKYDLSDAKWSGNTPEEYAIEGYRKNVVAYRAIKEIADNIAMLNLELVNVRSGRIIDKHKLLDLLNNPNPMQTKNSFMTMLMSFKQITGNTYIQKIGPSFGAPKELYILPPGQMRIEPGTSLLIPEYYEYNPKTNRTSTSIKFPVDQISGSSDILHIKMFNPVDQWYGQSPLAAASYSVDLHNEASLWNMKLLQNGARPSGALVSKTGMSSMQREIAKSSFQDVFVSSKNAGKPLLMEGDVEWIDMMLSPKDMDFLNARSTAAKDVAIAFRVPPILLNIGSDSTFNNMSEARLSMVENTIIPEADELMDELNKWLVPAFGDNLRLQYNKDKIPAIIGKQRQVYEMLDGVDFLTKNEKRELVGFAAIENGDSLPQDIVKDPIVKDPIVKDPIVKDPIVKDPIVKETAKQSKSDIQDLELKHTVVSLDHYHKYDPDNTGITSESDDHNHSYVAGDTKTGITNGHSHLLD